MTPKNIFVTQLEDLLKQVGGQDRSQNNLFLTRKAVSENLEKGSNNTYGFISFIRPDQTPSGPYAGLSVKVNPGKENYRISLDIGNEGFGDDYQLATLPGLRRLFFDLQKDIINFANANSISIKSFCALDFADDSSKKQLSDLELAYREDEIDSHKQDLFVAFVPKPSLSHIDLDDPFWVIYKAVIAVYAKARQWPSNSEERKIVGKFINAIHQYNEVTKNELAQASHLLDVRRYVVLQGAPGTGKTYLMNKLAKDYETVFTQFHAETTYSDFVGGYRPVTDAEGHLSYRYYEGPLLKAIRLAQKSDKKILLMIDEINRANLSNVLGEAFYLFENEKGLPRAKVQLGDIAQPQNLIEIETLPSNLYVMATMNTADRSLAIVDFALRRRFAWLTMYPHHIKPVKQFFHEKQFNEMHDIFQMYATSEELMLEPGQAYYLTPDHSDSQMNDRLLYELLPLIREYLESGFMIPAKDALNQFFMSEIRQTLFN
ncbi:McrB family protein [Secundilactobacillus folii]|uniref:AAA domain-containing protein n=1 Tax=Secundilactobacillus folii TaxID=2678357 RepID=A0A7X3C2J3_9LACO|nr:AAA family ATPase [Secundilactobacillus folii]MTV81616.1 AAA domain-containing protein [Secundilactobacillus folii]